jgi:plasmid stabilization system protein ParE
MAHRIAWSKRAVQDLDSIVEYIAADSPAYAGIVLRNIVHQTRILTRSRRLAAKYLNSTMKTLANSLSTLIG